MDSVARAISKQRTIFHLENVQAEVADTGGLDCQEDGGVGGEESLEDGYLQLEAVLGRSTRGARTARRSCPF